MFNVNHANVRRRFALIHTGTETEEYWYVELVKLCFPSVGVSEVVTLWVGRISFYIWIDAVPVEHTHTPRSGGWVLIDCGS